MKKSSKQTARIRSLPSEIRNPQFQVKIDQHISQVYWQSLNELEKLLTESEEVNLDNLDIEKMTAIQKEKDGK